MKLKHNKKRNTAFLFESLVREMTKAVVNKDMEGKQKVLSIIKEHFHKGTELYKEGDTLPEGKNFSRTKQSNKRS